MLAIDIRGGSRDRSRSGAGVMQFGRPFGGSETAENGGRNPLAAGRALPARDRGVRHSIAGELVTWIGREESSRNDRRYRLVFRIDGGRIGLLRFEEMED